MNDISRQNHADADKQLDGILAKLGFGEWRDV